MHLAELKAKSPADLLACAEDLNIENASSLRKQDMMFAILKTLADNDQPFMARARLRSCMTGLDTCVRPNPTTFPARMIFTSPPHRSAVLACARVTRLKADSRPA